MRTEHFEEILLENLACSADGMTFERYMYVMADLDGYFDLIDDSDADVYMTIEELEGLEDGQIPDWVIHIFNKFEIDRFGVTVEERL